MNKSTKLMFVTGDRAEYDLLYPVISAAEKSDDFSAEIVVCGSHLVRGFGNTERNIENDNIKIAGRIDNLLASDSPTARAKSMGIETIGLSDVIAHHAPDFILILGDREDCIAAAIVGVYSQIPVVHFGGGDRADDGNSDNVIRDAVSKLSHLHFATTPRSRDRLIQIGEAEWRCYTVGATGLDRLCDTPDLTRSELLSRMGLQDVGAPYAVLIQHPLLPEHTHSGEQILETLKGLEALNVRVFISRPNSDPGNAEMRKVIRDFASKNDKFMVFENLPRFEFVNLLRHAAVLVGNSSSGIIEAPHLNLPAVNIGNRQMGREHAANVVFVEHDREQIATAVSDFLNCTTKIATAGDCHNPYGHGDAARQSLAILRQFVGAKKKLLWKR